MKPKSIRVVATLTLTSPFHQSCVRPVWADPAHMRVTGEKLDFPATGTVNMPILLTGQDQEGAATNGDKRTRTFVPIILSNSIRGRLRRIIAQIVLDWILEHRKEQVSIETFHGMMCGAVTGNGNVPLNLNSAQAAAQHVFLGLVGGSPRMCNTRYQISLVPAITKSSIAAGMVPEEFKDLAATNDYDLTTLGHFLRVDDVLRFTDPNADRNIADYPNAVRGWMEEVSNNNDKRKASKSARKVAAEVAKAAREAGAKRVKTEPVAKESKVALQGFNFKEVVIPGTSFYIAIDIEGDRIHEGALGLFIEGFTKLANTQNLGGEKRNGLGRFTTSAKIYIDGEARGPLLVNVGGVYSPNDGVKEVAAAMQSWAEAADTLTAAGLEDLFSRPSGEEPDSDDDKKTPDEEGEDGKKAA